jgi:hypothetical protein
MFEEDPFLALCPRDVIHESVDLDLPAIGDRSEEVEEGSDFCCCQ